MKTALDYLQIFLTGEASLALLVCLVLAVLLLTALKFTRRAKQIVFRALTLIRALFLRPNRTNLILTGCLAAFLFIGRFQAAQIVQVIKQRWVSPTFITAQDTSAWATSRYESELDRHLSERQSETVKRRTRETAARIGATPGAIYQVAQSECGLDPFAFNINKRTGDTLAAGWIQFTPAGLRGLLINGMPATFARVKQACRERDVELIMDLTDQYLIRAAAGRPLSTGAEIYTAIFAPSAIGKPASTVLYSGHENPAYYLNEGLDGRRFTSRMMPDGREKIFWTRKPDGAITKNDLRLHLAWKCAMFLKQ